MDFKNRVVLVTGASRGIGAALARAFAGEGATVVVNYVQQAEAAAAVVAQCRELGGDAFAIRADVSQAEEVNAMVAQALAEAGSLHVVVNSALRPYRFDPDNRKRFWELGWADYQSQIDGAVQGAYNTCQAVLPHWRQRGSGCVVNLSSNLVERPVLPYHDYATAKSALVGFSRNLAAELGPLGIRVNCVAPGLVWPTDASRHTREDVKDAIRAQTPLRRIATPEDIAGPVLFLASDWSRFMTGQVLLVDGGLVMA